MNWLKARSNLFIRRKVFQDNCYGTRCFCRGRGPAVLPWVAVTKPNNTFLKLTLTNPIFNLSPLVELVLNQTIQRDRIWYSLWSGLCKIDFFFRELYQYNLWILRFCPRTHYLPNSSLKLTPTNPIFNLSPSAHWKRFPITWERSNVSQVLGKDIASQVLGKGSTSLWTFPSTWEALPKYFYFLTYTGQGKPDEIFK